MLLIALMSAALAEDPVDRYNANVARLGLESSLPKEGVAFAESAVVGFGAGHFYAKQYDVGTGFAVFEGAALIAVAGGMYWQQTNPNKFATGGGPELVLAGVTGLVVTRMVDAALAPMSARKGVRQALRPEQRR